VVRTILHDARTTVILQVIHHHSSLAGTKLYCLMGRGVNNSPGVVMQPRSNRRLNPWPLDCRSDATTPSTHHAQFTKLKNRWRWDADLSCDQLIDGWLDAVRPVTSLQRLKPLVIHTHTTSSTPAVWKGWLTDWIKGLHPTPHKMGHFWDVLSSQFLGLVRKKLRLRQRKQMTQEQNGQKNTKSKPKSKENLNLNLTTS